MRTTIRLYNKNSYKIKKNGITHVKIKIKLLNSEWQIQDMRSFQTSNYFSLINRAVANGLTWWLSLSRYFPLNSYSSSYLFCNFRDSKICLLMLISVYKHFLFILVQSFAILKIIIPLFHCILIKVVLQLKDKAKKYICIYLNILTNSRIFNMK